MTRNCNECQKELSCYILENKISEVFRMLRLTWRWSPEVSRDWQSGRGIEQFW